MNKKISLGIVGGGTVGRGLIKLFIKAGISSVVVLRDKKRLKMLKNEMRQYQKEKFPHRPRIDIKFSTDIKELTGKSIIIEAIVEDFTQKVRLYRILKKIIDKNTLVATTTSSLSINNLADEGALQTQFIGLHFFHPVQVIPFLEIIPEKTLNPKLFAKALNLAKTLNYEYIILPDSAGFVANRILFALLLAACELNINKKIKESVIDEVVRKSLGHPLGPFELLNFIGLETSDKIFRNLFAGQDSISVWEKYYEKSKGKTHNRR